MTVHLRTGTAEDAPAIFALIAANVAAGHLLPRTRDDIAAHASRFVVAACVEGDAVIGCAELASLSESVAEVRSLVVDDAARGRGTGLRLIDALSDRARAAGYVTLCAFTHRPSHFLRLGFSIVPHVWIPEKVARDCASCSQFRRCGQYAVVLPLRTGASVRWTEGVCQPARAAAPPRASVERLRLRPVAEHVPERVPA